MRHQIWTETGPSGAQRPKGSFREPGSLHLHVNSRSPEFIAVTLEKVRTWGLYGKSTSVLKCVQGSRRDQLNSDAHTPPGEGEEHFLSILVDDRQEAVTTLKRLLGALHAEGGVVVEVERVLGRISLKDPRWRSEGEYLEGKISAQEVLWNSRPSSPVEVHHCFECPKEDNNSLPFTLEQLSSGMDDAGVQVHKWSLFDRPGVWSFRSTVFIDTFFDETQYRDHFEKILTYVQSLKCAEAWIVAEEILGIWQTPLEKSENTLSFPNRISFHDLVGTSKEESLSPVLLTEIVQECDRAKLAERTETDAIAIKEILTHLSSLEGIVRSAGCEPILLELAIAGIQPKVSDRRARPPQFRALLGSYHDTRSADVLAAWQTAIKPIVAPQPVQIAPIVCHPETHQWACFHTELGEWVLSALSAPLQQRGIRTVREFVDELSDRNSEASWGARKVFDFHFEPKPAPIERTLKSLARGFVYSLAEGFNVRKPFSSAARPVWNAIRHLLSAHLLVVPFMWQPRDHAFREDTHANLGGCLFVVLGPGTEDQPITTNLLKDVTVRLSWMLSRSALEESYIADSVQASKASGADEPTLEAKLISIEQINEFRDALELASKRAPTSRYSLLAETVSWMKDVDERVVANLKQRVQRDNSASVWKWLWLNHFGTTEKTMYRWQQELAQAGMFTARDRRPGRRQRRPNRKIIRNQRR